MRIVTGATKLCSIAKLYDIRDWKHSKVDATNRNFKFSTKWYTNSVVSRNLYSFVVYLYVNGSGSITSVGEERANLSAVV